MASAMISVRIQAIRPPKVPSKRVRRHTCSRRWDTSTTPTFTRAYWVYGRSFAGGHGGYYQAGKYAPAGRILVADQDMVYGFGRNPQYLKWTTTIEHQLFATAKQPPKQARESLDDGRTDNSDQATFVKVKKSPSLNPRGKSLAVSAWINAERPDGVVLAHGGPSHGYALLVRGGKPRFLVRADKKLASVTGPQDVIGRWVHLVGLLNQQQQLELYGRRPAGR